MRPHFRRVHVTYLRLSSTDSPIARSLPRSPNDPSLHGEHPDRTPLWHIRILAGEDQVHARLNFRGVDAPAGLHRDVLLAVDLERYRHRGNARAGRKLPQHLAGPGVERAEHAVVGAAREQHSAARGEDRTPIERGQVGRPYLFAGIEIPCLQLTHVVGAGNEVDLVASALELPEIAVSRDVDEALYGSPVAPVVDDQRRREFVPIPGVVGMILKVSLDLPGAGVEGDHRAGEEIVAGTLIAEPWAAVAGAPESEIGLGVVSAGDPDRSAAPLIVVAARGPGLAARLARRGHRIGLPELLAGLRIEGREEAARAQFTA